MHVQSLMLFSMEMFSEHTDEGSTSIKGLIHTLGTARWAGRTGPYPPPDPKQDHALDQQDHQGRCPHQAQSKIWTSLTLLLWSSS